MWGVRNITAASSRPLTSIWFSSNHDSLGRHDFLHHALVSEVQHQELVLAPGLALFTHVNLQSNRLHFSLMLICSHNRVQLMTAGMFRVTNRVTTGVE
jgi:hypothetical protein